MSLEDPTMYALTTSGIYVGNYSSSRDLSFLANADISAMINLSGKPAELIEDVDTFDFLLPNQELLNAEIDKTVAKLQTISQVLYDLLANRRSVLIYCADGINKSLLAAGFYLITRQNKPYATIIEQLEMLYFSHHQKLCEVNDRKLFKLSPEEIIKLNSSMTAEKKESREAERAARREIICLTNSSFRKILRLSGGAKK